MSESVLLPKNLKYGSKLESAPCKSSRVNIAPQNGTDNYGLGSTIIINIPTRRNLLLVPSESYLKFSHTFNNTTATNQTALRWDSCGAHGLIQRIRVFHGSNLLQDIDNYSMITKMLFDLQVNTPSTYGKYSILAGTRADTMTSTLVSTADGTDPASTQTLANALKALVNVGMSNVQINSGAYLGVAVAGNAPANASSTTTYCLNLVSLVGSLCQQHYLPLFAIDSAPLRVEITLQDSINKIYGCCNATTPILGTFNVSNVEYIANFIELSDRAMGMVYESLQGQPLQFVVPDYRSFQYTAAVATGTQISVPIAAKFSSLKSLFICSRDHYAADTYQPLSSVANGLSSYYFRIGPVIMPPKAPSTYPEMFAECIKAISSMGDLYHSPSIDLYSYQLINSPALTNATVTLGNQSSGSFYIGIDLENYANASKDNIFAGYNSLTDDIYCTMTYGTVGAALQMRYDIFAMFDTVLVFENGTAYARY